MKLSTTIFAIVALVSAAVASAMPPPPEPAVSLVSPQSNHIYSDLISRRHAAQKIKNATLNQTILWVILVARITGDASRREINASNGPLGKSDALFSFPDISWL
jgi:hypothetical protein